MGIAGSQDRNMERLPKCFPEWLNHFPLHQHSMSERVAPHPGRLPRGQSVGAQGDEVVRPPCHASLASSLRGDLGQVT